MVAVLGKVHGTKKTGGGASNSETGLDRRSADVTLAEVAAEGSARVVADHHHVHAVDEEQGAAPGGKSKGGRGTYVKIKLKIK